VLIYVVRCTVQSVANGPRGISPHARISGPRHSFQKSRVNGKEVEAPLLETPSKGSDHQSLTGGLSLKNDDEAAGGISGQNAKLTLDLDDPAARINIQAAEIASLKREIDDIRAFAKKPGKPWFLDGALLVAIAAFAFTLMTAYRQDVNDTRLQLTNVLKELYAMPATNAEAMDKFKHTPTAMQVSQGLEAQNLVLTKQAYALAHHLGRSLDPAERVAVANAIFSTQPRLADKLLLNADIPTDDIENFVAAKLILGEIQIGFEKNPAGGDGYFQSAEDVVEHGDLNTQAQIWELAFAERMWGLAYTHAHVCSKAYSHLISTKEYIKKMVPEAQAAVGPDIQATIGAYDYEGCTPPIANNLPSQLATPLKDFLQQ
jgi:hypothetical protein